VYKASFILRRKIPMNIVYYTTKAIGTTGMKTKVTQLKEAVDKCEEIGKIFYHFTKGEWIFDNSSSLKVAKTMTEEERKEFNFDVMRIKWKMYVMNHAYGIKKFILKEEAELPSKGYNDIVTVNNRSFYFNMIYSSWLIDMERITCLSLTEAKL
jgi:hypothetical protein